MANIPIRMWGPYEDGRFVPIWSVRPLERRTFRVLGEFCVIPLVHFLRDIPPRGRDDPCRADAKTCPGCIRFLRPRPLPFLACWSPDLDRHCLLQLSKDCLRHCPALQPNSDTVLRGRHITVWRDGRLATSPVRASLTERDPEGLTWPIGADEIAVLCRLWGIDQEGLVLVDEAA